MLTYPINQNISIPLYEYLYKCIKNDITSGAIAAGEKLPSKRSFAKNLGVSVITVENAYAALVAEGYVYSQPKRGYYASSIKVIPGPGSIEPNTEKAIEETDTNTFFADYTSNRMDTGKFPFSTWAKYVRESLSDNREDLLKSPPVGGTLALRTAIAKHLKDFRGMEVSPEQIIVGAGTEYLYGLLLQLLGLDKTYGIEDPGYSKIAEIYKSHGSVCKAVPIDEYGVRSDRLSSLGVDVIHISPSHHFPTGIVMPIGRRYELLSWASESPDRYIIEDDYDSEFRLTGKPIPTLSSIDLQGKVIYMNTFTKSLASTVRISYMVLPGRLMERFRTNLGFYSCTVSNIDQYTLAKFIDSGHFEKHINRMRNYYLDKRNFVIDAIEADELGSLVSISEEDAGLHFLMTVKTDISDDELVARAEEKGIKLAPLSYFYRNREDAGQHVFVINYSSVSYEAITESVRLLGLLLQS
ncbi:MAG: PLP-dependent aminotransferase family protein [Clostridia bacterium]|nr:PLP-dependent aminotransferase family protein [Clostridia bacterium]